MIERALGRLPSAYSGEEPASCQKRQPLLDQCHLFLSAGVHVNHQLAIKLEADVMNLRKRVAEQIIYSAKLIAHDSWLRHLRQGINLTDLSLAIVRHLLHLQLGIDRAIVLISR